MTYQQTLDYLFAQLPIYQRIGKAAYKADLENTWWLMDHLKNPHTKFKSIHVGGTNGKGSTSHLLASVFQEAGYKTGLYTSPHLVDFRERIRVNGAMISEDKVISFTATHKHAFANQGLSFFEWTVGLAFEYFSEQDVDIAIIEVGLGGRLDSTNVITPELSIITNIGLDHTQFLGDTKEKIATEKAGIIKSGVPVVIGKTQPETKPVFEKTAKKQNADIFFADNKSFKRIPESALKGSYQVENLKSVLCALSLLNYRGFAFSESQIDAGFKNVVSNTNLKGRWDIISTSPTIICDVGHNREGLEQNIEQLKQLQPTNLHFLLGFVNDKELDNILDLFPWNANYHLTQASVPRAYSVNALEKKFKARGFSCKSYTTPQLAYDSVSNELTKNDCLYVGGSTFIVADFYKLLSKN
jgi:dihydrofolate synthase/folylpolyglutamate synthase